jgi:hypothetical protein
VTAFFKEDGAEEEYQSVELGATASADALADATLASLYTGEIPALPAEVKQVSYFIESVDSAGVARRFPPEAPEQTLVYRADGPLEEAFHLIISERGQEALSSQSIHSNDLVDATVIYDNEQTFYNVGARYRGSPWGRGQRQSYRLRFGEDQMFKGKLSEVNFGQRDAQSDGPAYFFYRRSGTAENPAPASDYHYVRGRRDGGPAAMYGLFEPVNRNFVRRWFGPEAADDAVVLKADGRMRYSDSCDFIDWDEVVLYHRDEDPENYRFYWFHALNRSRDNWQPFIDGTRVLSPRTTPDEEFDRGFESVVDLDAWMRVYMARVLMNDGDGLFLGNGHNGYVLWDPTDGRFHYLPFDMGGALGGQPATLRLVRDKVVQRFMNHPRALRLYYRLIHEFSQGYWSPDIAGPYLEALEEDFPGPGKRALDFVRVSSNNLPDKLEPFVSPQLRILTNDGEDFTTDLPRVQLEGEVSVVAPTLRMRQNGGPMQPFEPVWTSATDWTLELSLSGEENLIEIFALDADGASIDFTSMTIGRGPLRSFLRGDVNGDQALNIADPVATLNSLFQGGLLTCEDAADFDDSGRVEITDAIASLDFSFRDGSPPPAPFPTPGEDPTDDSLECRG